MNFCCLNPSNRSRNKSSVFDVTMQKSKSESNLKSRYRSNTQESTNDADPKTVSALRTETRIENVNARFRTDPLLNNNMMDEFRAVQEERRKSSQSYDAASPGSPRTSYLASKATTVLDDRNLRFQVHDFINNWRLSALSHFFLDQSVLVNYNHLILERLEGFKQQKFIFGLFQITPHVLYLFRRILQAISIALVTLFVIILYAMSKNSDKINTCIPSQLDQVPQSLQNIGTIILDEFVASILNETDRVFQRWTESDLEPALSLIKQAQLDPFLEIKPKHPIIIFPGITSNALQLWQSDIADDEYVHSACSGYGEWNKRKRIWGSANSITEMLRSPKCWLYHMMLNESTGLDANGIKLRSIEGPTGADYLFPGYWVWALVLDNLVTVGYDTNMIYFANFDWRLARNKLNVRDGYWSRCKFEIEMKVRLSGEKAVVIGHSMGANMVIYFLQWVISNHPKGGHGGKDWVDKHIASYIPIGGPLLGSPKIIPMYLFGEALESVVLPRPLQAIKEMLLPRSWFNRFVRSNQGGMQLAPIGGELIWGHGMVLRYVGGEPIYSSCHLSVEVDVGFDFDNESQVHPFDFDSICCKSPTEKEEEIIDGLAQNYTVSNWTQILRMTDERTYDHLMSMMELSAPTKDTNLSDDALYDKPKYFGNPLWRALPFAPHMSIYCMYGTGSQTERSYVFMRDYNTSFRFPFRINSNYNEDNFLKGVQTVDGDGTIPLLSLGFMCAKGWRDNKRLNPSRIKTKIIEYPDKKESLYERGTVRGGKESGDHVDIMGNHDMIKNILLIAMGYGENNQYVNENVRSEIHQMSHLVDI